MVLWENEGCTYKLYGRWILYDYKFIIFPLFKLAVINQEISTDYNYNNIHEIKATLGQGGFLCWPLCMRIYSNDSTKFVCYLHLLCRYLYCLIKHLFIEFINSKYSGAVKLKRLHYVYPVYYITIALKILYEFPISNICLVSVLSFWS